MAQQTSSLESFIRDVIARAVTEAVEAVRRNILDEVSLAIGAPKPSTPAARAASAPTPRAVAAPAAAAGGKRTWPSCTRAGCSSKFFGPSGDARLCYQHYLDAGGKHPNQAKAAPKAAAKVPVAKAPAAKAPAAKAPAAKTPAAKPASTPAKATSAAGKSKGKASGGGAVVADALLGQVVDLIARSPGLRAEQISKQLGAKPEPVKAVLASLRESKRVKVSGKARGTTYSL